jgi:hypothetical protein
MGVQEEDRPALPRSISSMRAPLMMMVDGASAAALMQAPRYFHGLAMPFFVG